jgi:hypothetical protein
MPTIAKYVKIPGEGDSLTVTITVKNTGNVNINAIYLRPLLWQNSQFFDTKPYQTVSLNVGEQKTLTWTFSPVQLLSDVNPSNPNYKLYIAYCFDNTANPEQWYDTGWIVQIYEIS